MEKPKLGCLVFEALGRGELSPDKAIHRASKEVTETRLLLWTMPLALGLWMNKRYSNALEALQQPGVEKVCGHIALATSFLGW